MFYLNSIHLTLKNKLKSLFFIGIFIGSFLITNKLNASTTLICSGGSTIIGSSQISTYSWPVVIVNSDPTTPATITLLDNIVLNTSTQYFIISSNNIKFDGNNKQVTIDNVANYPGVFQNGTSNTSGYNSIEIKNISIVTNGSSTLASFGGWLCQAYFSNGTILNSYSTGTISGSYTGGLLGANTTDMNVSNCYTTGSISGIRAAGIVGAHSVTSTVTDCHSFGIISGSGAGGIYGYNAQTCVAKNCYSTGSISGVGAGGIYGNFVYDCQANSSFSTGTISNTSGGIFGAYSTSSIANTCYSKGSISNYGGGIFGNNSSIATANYCYTTGSIGQYAGGMIGSDASDSYVTHSYSTGVIISGGDGLIGANSTNSGFVNSISSNGSWSDVDANQVLAGANTFNVGISQAWTSLNVNTPFALTYFLTPNTTVTLPSNGSYHAGNNLDFTVNYNKNITVDVTGGTPKLELSIGGQTKYANYLSGSGTNALVYRYTVSNLDNGAITINNLSYNGGSLVDADGLNVALTLNGISSNSIVIDNVTIPITISAPTTNSYVSNAIPLSFNMPETMLPGSLTMTLNSSAFSITYQMSDRAVGNYTWNLNSRSDFILTYPTYFTSASPAGNTNIPAGTYTLTMSYRDLLDNPVVTSSVSGIRFKYVTTPPVLLSPVAATKCASSLLFKYTMPEAAFPGSKKIIIAKNNITVTTITLRDNDNDSIYFDLHHILSSGGTRISSVIGLDSLSDGNYTCSFSYQDVAGNPAAVISASFIKETSPFIGVLSHSNSPVFGPFTETITFNKSVDFIASNPIIPNLINNSPSASLGALQPNSDRTIFTFTVTPLQQGKIKLQAPFMGVAYDSYGNVSQVIAVDSIEYIDTTIRVNPTVTGVVSFCQGDSTILSSSTAKTYLWSTGATTKSIVVKQSGTYNVKVTYDNFISGTSSNIVVTANAYPAKPTISRDGNNNLVSSAAYGNTWYESGSALKDTANIIKPSKAGIYSVRAIQLGCTSSLSADYYYVVTDVINLSNNEFIKLVPNPFTSQVNFDYAINGYSKMNIEIIDLSTGYKVESMKGLLPGISLNLGHLKAGTYVFMVSSIDNKLNYQFKMVKL